MTHHNDDHKERLKKLKEASENTFPSERLLKSWEVQNQQYLTLSTHSKSDILHFQKYKEKHLTDKYFKLEHIEDIGLPFDVALVLAKRGVGKTWNYLNRLAEVAKRGEQFVIVRNSKTEIEGGVIEELLAPHRPFDVIGDKVYWRDDTTYHIGYLAYLSGKTQKWQGASFEKVTTIVWDEATNGGKNSGETRNWIRAFWQLTSTFFRNRIGGKVWIFGNLMKDNEQKISDELLKYLALDSDWNFKYQVNKVPHSDIQYRLLYINTGNMYIGGETHLMSNISLDQEIREDLASNLPSKISDCIVSDHFYTKAHTKLFGLFTRFDSKDWMILIASEPYVDLDNPEIKALYEKGDLPEAEEEFFIIRCEPLRIKKIGFEMPIFTDDWNLWNTHKCVSFFKRKEKMVEKWYKLSRIIRSGRACYVGDEAYFDLTRIMSGRKDEINTFKDKRRQKIKQMTSKSKK